MDGISNNIKLYSMQQPLPQKQSEVKTSNIDISSLSGNNLIKQYLDNVANQNKAKIPKENWLPEYTDSGVGKYQNMLLKDASGNVVQEVKYSKEGSKITENITVNSYDGSKFNKVISKDGNKKTMDIDFKDKDGKQLIKESRTYEKIDDDTAISTHNGKEYKITGLKGNVITIENDGKKSVVDFDKLVDEDTETIDQKKTGNKITPEQKEFLISRFKTRPADIILRLPKEVEKLTFMDTQGYEGWYTGFKSGKRSIKTCKAADDFLEMHELGHGVNEDNDKTLNGKRWSDDNPEYLKARDEEIANFNNTVTEPKYKEYMQKFSNCEYFVKNGSMTPEEAKKEGADEEFAETFGFMNDIDIDRELRFRTTSLVQYMPKSVTMAYNESQNR